MAHLRNRLTTVGLTVLLSMTLLGAESAHADITPTTTYIAVSNVDFDPNQTYTLDQVAAMEAAASQAGASTSMTGASPTNPNAPTATGSSSGGANSGQVTPYSVASGFVLYNPGYRRTDFVYDSDWGPLTELECTSSCNVVSKYQTRIHEYIVGGSSKNWQITLYYQHVSGNYASSFSYWYACAVNVSGSPDHYCQNGADPSGSSGTVSSGTTLYRYFEDNTYPNIEYPMVSLTVHWPQVSNSNNNRGWDVCTNSNNTKLCSTSGTGH